MKHAFTPRSIDMVKGPLLKNTFIFAIPLMLSNLLQIIFNSADTIVVGKFGGQAALAAVGATGSLVNLLVSLFNGISTGSNIVIARQIGGGEDDKIRKTVHTSFFLALAGGVLLTILGLFISKPLLKLMGTPDDIIDLSALYLKIYFSGSIPLCLYDFGSSILRAKGDTSRPMAYLTVSGILNILLNLFFVIVLKMTVSGVAIATVASECVSAFLIVRAMTRENGSDRLYLDQIRPYGTYVKQILRIGIPAGFQGMMWAISNVAVQSAINSFGSIAIAGNSAAANVESFTYIGMFAFSQAIMTFTSQCAGAKEYKRIRHMLGVFSLMTVAWSLAACGLEYLVGRPLLSLYTNDSRVIDAGMIRMKWVMLPLFLNALLDIPGMSMRGMGYSTTPTLIMFLGIVGVRLLYIYTFWQFHQRLDILYMCFPLSWAVTVIIMFLFWILYYRRFLRSILAPEA